MKQLMSALQIFYKMSGLKIYEEKTKALWRGPCQNHRKICQEYDLDMEQKPVKIIRGYF